MSALVDVSVLQWLPAEAPVDIAAVREGLARLMGRVPGPGAVVEDVSLDGRVVRLRVSSVVALSSWCDVVRPSSAATASRDGGGLSWFVTLAPVVELPGVRVELTAVSGEFERLPRTRLVRDLCPWTARMWAIEDREAAAAARLEVAA